MATNKLGFPATDSYICIAEESTFGTPIGDDAAYKRLNILDNNVPSFDPNEFLDNNIRNRGTNIIDINDYYTTDDGMWQSYSIPQNVGNSTILKHMLYAACQTVSEGATTPYVATYTMNGATKPDFSSNAGYFFTLLVKEPFASFSKKLTSCVLQDLTINLSPDNGGRLLWSGTAITGKGYSGVANPSGENWNATAFDSVAAPNFHNATASTLSINSQDCVWYSAELNIANQFDFTGYSSGDAENYTLIGQKITGNFVVKYDANTDTFLNAKNSSLEAVTLTIGANNAASYFKFTCNDSWCDGVTADRGGTDTVQKLNISFEFANDYANTQYVSFETADAVDATW